MAGPEAIQEWLDQQGGLKALPGPYRPGRDGFDLAAVAAAPALIPVAFLGRTSTDDQQDPVGSLLRQLRISQEALPDGCVIVAYFYDVESGRKDLDVRGRGDRHERLAIPIPRDGGIHDLLTEAANPNRRFQAVICEQIDRIARRTYYGTLVEHQLQSANVGLWAADEPIRLDTDMLIDPTTVLTRRVKQGIAEWYALDMIKRARDGFETHTDQGYNVGKACYGYRAAQVRLDKQDSDNDHPSDQGGAGQTRRPRSGNRGKGRNGPRTKSKLVKEPIEAAVVRKIYDWRIAERLSYEAIAERLNLDLATNPPPMPPDPERAVGWWTGSSVRDVLNQPKYTGYMVWNRRAMKTRNGSPNPMEKWVWSTEPTHEKIINLPDFIAAQQVVRRRERSRTSAGANTHPQTKRTYRLRSYLFCDICGRRMFGKTRRQYAYYACAPRKGYVPDGHPDSLWVREVALLDGLNKFLSHHVFGLYRHELLSSALHDLGAQAEQTRTERITAIKKSIDDLDVRKKRLIRTLEVTGDDDDLSEQELIQDIKNRRAEIKAERAKLAAELETLEERINDQQNPDLLRFLPVGTCDLDAIPENLARKLFEALRLEIHYNKTDNTALCRITLSGETLPALLQTTREAGAVIPFKQQTDKKRCAKTNTNETDGAPSDPSPPFPSAVCPRQDSNLRPAA
jgi:DNA invertase Pin-like site-specific DNA recombinase